jgi:hypothetical protein
MYNSNNSLYHINDCLSRNLCFYNSSVSGCLPFNPDDVSIQSASAKCNLARQCGTTWNGACQ